LGGGFDFVQAGMTDTTVTSNSAVADVNLLRCER